ncbi:MAG: hypothetical protein ACI9GW_003253, partial [Halieaceae bacterium]
MTHIVNAPPLQIPDGRCADREEMSVFGETLKNFVLLQENALDEVTSLSLHNQIVDFLNVLADAYNEQLVLFNEAEQLRQRHLLGA